MQKKVSIQGFEGCFHQVAAKQYYGKGTEVICCATFKEVIKNLNVGLSDAEVRMLFEYFNTDNRGLIDSEQFIKCVRDSLSEKRLNLVKQAFAKLDVHGEGGVDAGDVAQLYDATSTPDVLSGRVSVENAFSEFLETFDVGGEIDGKVTLSEFINYYTNISACIDNDDYFRILIRNAWHIGGENTEENSRKILVTRTDGSQVKINFILLFINLVLLNGNNINYWFSIQLLIS